MKKLLKERFQKLAGIKEEERFNSSTKTVAGLADLFLTYSKGLRKGEYKGIQAGEINEIDDLIAMVLQGAEEGNITALLQRLESMLVKTIKSDPVGVDFPNEDEII
tara:strand:+ start:168 stop:485 length:318 start_codon:yes stop_codon:yes gene_type:complete